MLEYEVWGESENTPSGISKIWHRTCRQMLPCGCTEHWKNITYSISKEDGEDWVRQGERQFVGFTQSAACYKMQCGSSYCLHPLNCAGDDTKCSMGPDNWPLDRRQIVPSTQTHVNLNSQFDLPVLALCAFLTGAMTKELILRKFCVWRLCMFCYM